MARRNMEIAAETGQRKPEPRQQRRMEKCVRKEFVEARVHRGTLGRDVDL